MAKPPPLLTVEEAGQLLRIGRTKAYAMAKQWRQTGGQCGLPVLDFGDVLRVPLAKLEEVTGAEFSDVAETPAADINGRSTPDPSVSEVMVTPDEPQAVAGTPRKKNTTRAARRRRKANDDQLDLFEPRSPRN